MEKAYLPQDSEARILARWEGSGAFTPRLPKKGEPVFSIMIPPPNVTGVLHVGHALFLTIQDLMTRFARMRGKVTLWLPGTDHAAIATQAKVEQKIAEQGQTRQGLGREKFLEEVWAFVREHQHIITRQVKAMGASVDWTRERFTLDEGLSRAVRMAFVRLYEDGLITRGSRIVNWCPRCTSTLADDEVSYREEPGELTYMRYPVVPVGTMSSPDLAKHKDFIAVATTRPETMLGDTAVAVHPKDKTWKKFHGKAVWLPIRERAIPIILDESIDPEYGSGAVKVTPAHDPNDFNLGQKHHLAVERIMDDEAHISLPGSPYHGLSRELARERIVAEFERLGLLGTQEPIAHRVAHCYRCDTVIETLTSLQWFVRVDQKPKSGGPSLKERALAVLKDGPQHIEIIPERFEKIYRQWMENLHDWCISRQIWWGHQIPVWTRGEEVFVGTEAPAGQGWIQDSDTLDTWFSSGLWTFSTLGWPEDTDDLKAFHPTSILETGHDIIFFWVARMILLTGYLLDEVPFRTVYLHGLVRDGEGKKMSKSVGNVLDPLDMIPKYGADALRLSLVLGTTPGNDSNVSEEKIAGYRNFVNKLWNVARFIEMASAEGKISDKVELRTLADRWIASRFAGLTETLTADIETYRYGEAGIKLYDFLWSDFADWYLEASKAQEKNVPLLRAILRDYLRLLHPFAPFVTEEIWQVFGFSEPRVDTTLADSQINLLALTRWPETPDWADEEAERTFGSLQDMIKNIRTAAAEHALVFRRLAMRPLPALVADNAALISTLAKLKDGISELLPEQDFREFAAVISDQSLRFRVVYERAAVDLKKLTAEAAELQRMISSYARNLENDAFVAKAPAALIEQTKQKLAQAREKWAVVSEQLKK